MEWLYAKHFSKPLAPAQPRFPSTSFTHVSSIDMVFWIGIPLTGTLVWLSTKNVRNVGAPPLRTQLSRAACTPPSVWLILLEFQLRPEVESSSSHTPTATRPARNSLVS